MESDGAAATAAMLVSPRGLVFDSKGNLDIDEVYCNGIRRVTPDGIISTVYRLPAPPRGAVVAMSADPTGRLDLSEGSYSLVLRLPGDGSIQRLAGNTAATNVGDGGPALQAGPAGSLAAVTLDPSGNMYIPESGLNLIREVTNATYALALSPNQISVTGSTPRTFLMTTSGNFAEPFPYAVRIRASGTRLSANRVPGLAGEPMAVSVNPAGLSSGTYTGTVAVILYLNGISQEVEVPVSLSVP